MKGFKITEPNDVLKQLKEYRNTYHEKGVYLGFNKIETIENEAFKNLRSLRFLTLKNNQFRSLDEKVFYGLNNLQSLDLENNQIKNNANLLIHS